ncbi:hypothetical protein I3760_01G244400, partial [Carya illinoinensis]
MVILFGVIAAVFLQCAKAQTVHVVGDSIGWTVPTGGASSYQTWAASKQFVVGDILLFNFVTNAHDVLQVPKESYDSCSSSNPIGDIITTGPINVTLSAASTHYYICTVGRHCLSGQKISVTVSSSPSVVPPTSTSTPPSTLTNPATPSPTSGTSVIATVFLQFTEAQTVHVVGDSIGWTVPTGGASTYQTWAASKQFVVGDILSFNFITNAHDILQVPKESYDSCSSSNHIGDTITIGPVNITLSTTGPHYYICTLGRHCLSGQKLPVTVSSSPSATPPTSTSTPPFPPTTSATPSPTSGTPADCAPTPASSPALTPRTVSPPNSSSS